MSTSPTTAYLVNNRDMHIGSIGSVHKLSAPPPLIPAHLSPQYGSTPPGTLLPFVSSSCAIQSPSLQRPPVETPFWVAFIFGNVSRCQGCKGRLARGENKTVLPPPNVLCIRTHALEFLNSLLTRETCTITLALGEHVVPHFANFNAIQHVHIPPTVMPKLLPQHRL